MKLKKKRNLINLQEEDIVFKNILEIYKKNEFNKTKILIKGINMLNFILLSLLTSLQIFVVVPLVILHIFKIQAYQISDQAEINELITKLNIKRATFIKESKPYGFVYGKWYIGYISKSENEKEGGQTIFSYTFKGL